jgi:hypothetical protein
MAIIPGVTVNWALSPRIIKIPAPLTEATIEDLQDTLLDIEDSEEGINFPKLRDTSGGQALGGGVSVGWTMQLNNAQVMFEARPDPLSTGTVTTTNSTGTILTDSAADFSGDGIYRGCTAFNVNTGSMGVVTEVISGTQLRNEVLDGGTAIAWTSGDAYAVYPNDQCAITGGNLVAIDENGAEISPIMPAPNVQIKLTSSSSATLQDFNTIQYSTFEGAVWIDAVNGSTGQAYPKGTPQDPVDNLTDALAILNSRGLSKLHLLSDITVPSGTDLDNLIVESNNWHVVTLESGASLENTEFRKVSLYGVMGGFWNVLEDCWTFDITNFCGWVRGGSYESIELAPYSVESLGQSYFDDCVPMYPNSTSVLTMNTNTFIAFTMAKGMFQINSLTTGSEVYFGLAEGTITLDSSCTGGDITVAGVGDLVDESTGTSVDITRFVQAKIIQLDSFGGGITIDAVNGVDADDYPAGTPSYPVQTASKALTLAASRGFTHLFFKGNATLSELTLSGYHIEGEGHEDSTITIDDCLMAGGRIDYCTVVGTFSNGSRVEIANAQIGTVGSGLYNITLDAHNCVLAGTIELNNSEESNLYSCTDGVPGSGTPVIEVNDCEGLGIWNYSGGIKLTNMITAGTSVSFNSPSGRLIVDSTDTQGSIIARGVGSISGTTGGTTITQTDLINLDTIADAIWNELTSGHLTAGTTGKALTDAGSAGNPWSSTITGNTDPGTFGELVGKKLLTIAKFLGLK